MVIPIFLQGFLFYLVVVRFFSTCRHLHIQPHLPSVRGRAKLQVCALSLQHHRHLSLRTSPVSSAQDQNQVLSVSRERDKSALGLLGRQFPVQILTTEAPSSGISGVVLPQGTAQQAV